MVAGSWSGAAEKGAKPSRASCGHDLAAFVEVDPRKIGETVHGAPVVAVDAAPRWAGALHLAAVPGGPARARILAHVRSVGLGGWPDVVAVA